MKRIAFALAVLLLAATGVAVAEDTAPTAKPRIEVRTLRVAEARADKVQLEVVWGYLEQENVPRPTQVDIIAILIGAHDQKLTAKATVPVPAIGPIPTTAKLGFTDASLALLTDLDVTVSVSPKIPGITDGSSNTIVARKQAVLHVQR